LRSRFTPLAIDEERGPFEPSLWSLNPEKDHVIEQVWFAGVHSDVGGGYPETQLSDITLDWMIGALKTTGLKFDETVLKLRPVDATHFDGKIHDSRTGVYNLTPALHRPIGLATHRDRDNRKDAGTTNAADPTQKVHPTVLQRWDADKSYRPPALLDYFKRSGDPRGK
jgi:hypothetical protein